MPTARDLPVAMALLSIVFVSSLRAGAADCCHRCGCKKIKKVTRLVKTLKEIKNPAYECSREETFHQKKGAICFTGYRCDKIYTPHTCWHCQESRCPEESCADVEHCVDKGHCHGDCKCSEEHHHKEHVHYEMECTCQGCMSCRTEAGCKTLYGASPHGCFKGVCIQKPSGTCNLVMPEVRWVTYQVCGDCDHSWCDDIADGGTSPTKKRATATVAIGKSPTVGARLVSWAKGASKRSSH